jgi:fused signal recognition particle receptor
MFEALKNKLKSWFSSVKPKPAKAKKTKPAKAKKTKPGKAKLKEIEVPVKFETGHLNVEPDLEKLKEINEQAKIAEQKPEKKGFFQRLKEVFTKTSITEEKFNKFFEQLELILLENNVAYQVVQEIRKELRTKVVGIEMPSAKVEETIKHALKEVISNILIEPFELVTKVKEKSPYVIIFFGINGSGKTTTIAKVAYMLKKNGISSVIAAADTFRAASIEQLEIHGKKLGVEVVKHTYGSDPTAVAFDAVKHAQSRGTQVVLIDTAGRMHTKENLMREMEKISRVIKPDLKIFVAESIAGNDVAEQAKIFSESVGIDGIILSKADVDEKGGAVLSVGYVTRNPILYLGTGQNYEDLEKFDRNKFLKSLGLE